MEFRALLPKRRMVRHYAPEPIPRETVERIVETVRRAPSAGYSQGQRLLVVMEDEGRAELVRIASRGWAVEDGLEPWLESAAVHIFVCTREGDYHERYLQEDKLVDGEEIEWPVPFWWVDIGATMQNIMLAAVNEGLGCGFVGPDIEPLRAYLGIPDEFVPIGVMPVGRPLPDIRSPSLKRGWVPFDDFARWERWG